MNLRRLLSSVSLAALVITILVTFVVAPIVHAASSGPNSPSSCVNATGVGTVAWSTPGNAKTSNNSDATATLNSTTSNYLKCTSFGFSIPADATINGIVLEIERATTAGFNTVDNIVSIVKADGTIGTEDKGAAGNWPTSDAYATYGSSSDLWSETWTYTDINDADFGAVLSASGNSFGLPAVDHMRITVYYTEAGGGAASQTLDVSNGDWWQ